MEFLLIVVLTLLNGGFAMSELALAASRKSRLSAMAQGGDKGAQAALQLLDHPEQFLSTVQVGITSIGVLNGIVGEAAFSSSVAVWLQRMGMQAGPSEVTATALVVALITFTTIIFGELVPKRIGQMYPEPVARWMARPMQGLGLATRPFVRLLSVCTQAVLRLLRLPSRVTRSMTAEEIRHNLEEGVDAGVIEQHEHQMLQNVFRLDDRPLSSLMVPRADLDWLDVDQTVAQCLQRLSRSAVVHSWYPVCRRSLDDVLGLISMGQLLGLQADPAQLHQTLAAHLKPAIFVPETLSGMELLEQFREKAGRLVLVVDEYGVVQGQVTPSDLLQAITGELQPVTQLDAWATQRADGSWLLDGLMPIDELKNRLALDELPHEARGLYNTLAGLLMTLTGRLPQVGEVVVWADWCFEVVDLDARRIDKVLASRLSSAANEPPAPTIPS